MLKDPEKTVGSLIDKQSIAFIGSIDEAGFPNTKAMLAPRKREGIHRFYFSTNGSSLRVSQYRVNPNACLYFCDRRFYRGIMLIGRVRVREDQHSKTMIWQSGDEQYYAKGVTDPDYCVLEFTAISGRYYSHFASETFEIDSADAP